MSQGINDLQPPDGYADFERELRGLRPAASGIDRDAVLFEAGRAAGTSEGSRRATRQKRLWQGVCGVLVGVCAGMWAVGAGRTHTVERVVYVTPAAQDAREAVGGGRAGTSLPDGTGGGSMLWMVHGEGKSGGADDLGGYLGMRDALLTRGLGAMKSPRESGSGGHSGSPLRTSDGLDALPAWQKEMVLFPGARL